MEKYPVLSPLEDFYLNAFYFLDPSRNVSMQIGLIPLNEYLSYYECFGAPDSIESFCRIIRQIDIGYVAIARKNG